jgi:hypothetical protein
MRSEMFTPSSHLVYRVEDGDSGDSGDNPRITWPAAWRQRWRLSPLQVSLLGLFRPSPREREGSAFPPAWAHIKNRRMTTRPWRTTGFQGLPALPIGARAAPKIRLTASRTSAKPKLYKRCPRQHQVARTFEATPHRGGSPPSAISVRRLARSLPM